MSGVGAAMPRPPRGRSPHPSVVLATGALLLAVLVATVMNRPRPGDGLEPGTELGPVVSAAARDRIVSPALRAYAAMATSADTGAVRDVNAVERAVAQAAESQPTLT